MHGLLSNGYLKAKPTKKDEKTYSRQMHVIVWHVNDKKEREDFTLYEGKETKAPHSISHWKKVKGRTLGVGVVEDTHDEIDTSCYNHDYQSNHLLKWTKKKLSRLRTHRSQQELLSRRTR